MVFISINIKHTEHGIDKLSCTRCNGKDYLILAVVVMDFNRKQAHIVGLATNGHTICIRGQAVCNNHHSLGTTRVPRN